MSTKPLQNKNNARAKVDSGLNRKQDNLQQRPESGVQSRQGEKEQQNKQPIQYQRTIQDEMITIVQDFLSKQNYNRTLEQFEHETQYISQSMGSQQELQLLQTFDRGDRDNFFKIWNQLIVLDNQQDYELWKLEFYIQIHFLIYPIHPYYQQKGQIDKKSINAFKQFLDSKGEDLSKTNEVLPFYALPYVQQPQKHPTFQHLFTQKWEEELRDRIKDLLSQLFSDNQTTQLEQLLLQKYDNKQKNNNNNNYQLQDQNQELLKKTNEQNQKLQVEIIDLKKKLNQQTQAYQELSNISVRNITETQLKWIQFGKDMIQVSKEIQKYAELNQNQQNQKRILQLKAKLMQYEKFLSQDSDDLINRSQDISLFDKVSVAEQEMSHITNNQQIQTPNKQRSIEEYVPLNYQKIIVLFTKSNDFILVASILQALRWRITRAKNPLQRRQVVVAYDSHDIIGTNKKNQLLAQFLILKSHPLIQCQTLKLLNALASDYRGRTYLTSNPTLIQFLVELIKKEQVDSQKRKNAIGALQKMSLRKQSQNYMIENNVIYYTLMILKNERNKLSEYTYEYITALIMNLSLSSRGKDKLIQHKELAFEVLYELIEYPNDQIRTFTNGTFYSLFSRKIMRDYAYDLGIPDDLPKLLENSDEKYKKQIQYMITQLQSDDDDIDQSQMEEENDVDDIEEDEEECLGDDDDEDDLNNQDCLTGEELLQKEFELVGGEAENQKLIMDSIILKEVQERNALNEQLKQSYLEKPNGQIPFYEEKQDRRNRGPQNIQQDEQKGFIAKPKIPRTPPGDRK